MPNRSNATNNTNICILKNLSNCINYVCVTPASLLLCVIKKDFCCEELAFQETPNCYWLLRLQWHLWKLYGQQSLQLVTFWIPFKAVNMAISALWATGLKMKMTSAPSFTGTDQRVMREKRLTVFSSCKKRSSMWSIDRDKGSCWVFHKLLNCR